MVDADAQVAAWLREAGLSRFAPRFAAALISPPTFLKLAPTDLDALGVDSPADRKRLSDLILELRRSSPLSTSPPLRVPSRPSVYRSRPVLDSLTDLNTQPFATLHSISAQKTAAIETRRISQSAKPSATLATMTTSPRNDQTATVTVCVRKRPLSRKEVSSCDRDIVTVGLADASLAVHELKEKVDLTKYIETHPFSFDHVFGEHVGNAAVYDATACPLVDTLFSGGRATCFAYGQTGAGKTFTMAGDGAENPGLYTLAVRDVFDRIRDLEREAWRNVDDDADDDFEPPDPPQVWISFYEIYASRLQDLLNRGAKLECREDANSEVQIVGLTERLCEVEEDVLALIREGSSQRSTGVTGANDDSSRSHAVFQIELREPPSSAVVQDRNTVVRNNLLRAASAVSSVSDDNKGDEIGRLCFIDLAGSERGSDTASSTRQTRMEGAEINKSLLALKECIRAMDKKKDHTPFRGSKLTQVLKASFLGKNCKTVMIANISPASSNVEHTLNTLRYSDRVKELRRERSGTGTTVDGKMNARRATYAHGLGSRTARTGVPLSSMSRTNSINVDDLCDDTYTTSNISNKPDTKTNSLKLSSDSDDTRTNGKPRSRQPGRRTSRIRVRVTDCPIPSNQGLLPSNEPHTNNKVRDGRLFRRGTSKVGEQIPPRPSHANTMLPRVPSKSTTRDKSLSRSSSVARVLTTTDIDPSGDNMSKITVRCGRGERESHDSQTEKRMPSPVMTRRRARELESQREAVERVDEDPSDSNDNFPLSSSESQVDPAVQSSRQAVRASNVAESAMKFYKTKEKDELDDEDILFASLDDLTAVVEVANGDQSGDVLKKRNVIKPPRQNGVRATVRSGKTRHKEGKRASGSSSDTEASGSVTESGKAELSAEARQVVRLHHMQIEELVRLTEADVALVHAVEKGEMDVQEYALKLSVNLSQKMDIVRTLQSKVKILD